eukprot:scaffold123711_cov16-Prasinocladus_malaysianus.AAC.1
MPFRFSLALSWFPHRETMYLYSTPHSILPPLLHLRTPLHCQRPSSVLSIPSLSSSSIPSQFSPDQHFQPRDNSFVAMQDAEDSRDSFNLLLLIT